MLRIEIDGHFHGSGNVPRPWVARIDGPDPRYGLRREFVRPMNDWRDAHHAWSGNTYGVVATFPLRRGHLYEVSRLRGRSSKRHVRREFIWLGETGRPEAREPVDVLEAIEEDGRPGAELRVPDHRDVDVWVAEIARLGTPHRLGWIVAAGERLYRVREGALYEVVIDDDVSYSTVRSGAVHTLSEREALEWLTRRSARSA